MNSTINSDLTSILLPKYANLWVALNSKQTQVIASGKSPKKVLQEANKKKVKEPVVTFVVKDYGFLIP